MSNVEKVKFFSDCEDISTVTNYKFLVVLITTDSYSNEETKKRISLCKVATAYLTKIIKGMELQPTRKLTFWRRDLNGYSQPSRTTLFSLGI
jgi:hypothetical protein